MVPLPVHLPFHEVTQITIPAITRAIVDHDFKLIEDFNAAAAKASYTLMQTLSQKDISVVMILPGAADKWDKLANNYAVKPINQCVGKIQQLLDPRRRIVIEQSINLNEQEKTAALLMRPCSNFAKVRHLQGNEVTGGVDDHQK